MTTNKDCFTNLASSSYRRGHSFAPESIRFHPRRPRDPALGPAAVADPWKCVQLKSQFLLVALGPQEKPEPCLFDPFVVARVPWHFPCHRCCMLPPANLRWCPVPGNEQTAAIGSRIIFSIVVLGRIACSDMAPSVGMCKMRPSLASP